VQSFSLFFFFSHRPQYNIIKYNLHCCKERARVYSKLKSSPPPSFRLENVHSIFRHFVYARVIIPYTLVKIHAYIFRFILYIYILYCILRGIVEFIDVSTSKKPNPAYTPIWVVVLITYANIAVAVIQ